MLTLRSFLVLTLALMIPATQPMAHPSVAGVVVAGQARVIDGDTLDIGGERVRLHGIDAPEMRQACAAPDGDWPCGAWARDELSRLIGGGVLSCTGVERDRYDRLVAACHAGGQDLGAALVERGAAVAYRRYSHAYVRQEDQARQARRGLWAQGETALVRPEQWRQTQMPVQTVPEDCAIKGNISSNGRIYHLPGQRDYERTRIDTTRGERWFCTEEQARAAGWRRARR